MSQFKSTVPVKMSAFGLGFIACVNMLVLFIKVLLPQPAEAIPAFARHHKVSCTTAVIMGKTGSRKMIMKRNSKRGRSAR